MMASLYQSGSSVSFMAAVEENARREEGFWGVGTLASGGERARWLPLFAPSVTGGNGFRVRFGLGDHLGTRDVPHRLAHSLRQGLRGLRLRPGRLRQRRLERSGLR